MTKVANMISGIKPIFLFVVAFLILASSDAQDILIRERDLIPEGVAYNSNTKTIYVSSTHKQKVIAIDPNGNIRDFIKEGDYGIGSVIGMEVDERRNHLWVNSCFAETVLPLKSPTENKKWRSSVFCFDAVTGEFINQIALESDSSFLNDITVLKNGDVYVTESTGNKVYKLKAGTNHLQLFLSMAEYKFLNGITSTTDNRYVFVSSTQGIIKVNQDSKEYFLLSSPDSINSKRIDGLALYRDGLIGHQSKRVVLFGLDKSKLNIISSLILDNSSELDGSTTGEIAGEDYYYIVNSQIGSGIDYTNRRVRSYESLKDIIVRRKKLESEK